MLAIVIKLKKNWFYCLYEWFQMQFSIFFYWNESLEMLNVVQNLISCGSQLLVPFFASVDQSGARVSIKKKFSEWAIKKKKRKEKKKENTTQRTIRRRPVLFREKKKSKQRNWIKKITTPKKKTTRKKKRNINPGLFQQRNAFQNGRTCLESHPSRSGLKNVCIRSLPSSSGILNGSALMLSYRLCVPTKKKEKRKKN